MHVWGQPPRDFPKISQRALAVFLQYPCQFLRALPQCLQGILPFVLALALAGLPQGLESRIPSECLGLAPQRVAKEVPKALAAFLCIPTINSSGPSPNACKASCLLCWAWHWLACPRGLRAGFQMKVWGQLPRDFTKRSQRAQAVFLQSPCQFLRASPQCLQGILPFCAGLGIG